MTENIFTEEFKEKLEREDREEEVTIEQLKAENALLQETRELFSRLETRVAHPEIVMRIQKINKQLEWMQGNVNHTIKNLEDER